MPTKLRIATFNLLNLDDKQGRMPTLDERIPIMRPQLVRLNADILCLQEVCGQEEHGRLRLTALNKLLQSTPYEGYHRFSTTIAGTSQVYESRNLVILSRYEIVESHQYMHSYAP